MKKKNSSKNIKAQFTNLQFKNGSYSLVMTAIVVAIIIVINLIIGQLPSSILNKDISDTQIYTTGEVTDEVLSQLDKDVDINVIADQSSIDSRIENFLEHYASLSSKLHLEYTDPILHPDVLTKYNVSQNTVVISCEATNKTDVISFDDILKYDEQTYYYYGTKNYTEFDGEGKLTSSIAYIAADSSKVLYTLSGHGESSLSSDVNELLEKSNMSYQSVNLLKQEAIPDDCSMLIINAPQSDLSDDEFTVIHNYLYQGGKVVLVRGVTDKELDNFDKLMAEYGLTMVNKYIGDKQNYYARANSYFYLFPQIKSSESNVSVSSTILVGPVAGMQHAETVNDNISITDLLTTSSNAFKEGSTDENQQYILAAMSKLSAGKEDEEASTEEVSSEEASTEEASTEEASTEVASTEEASTEEAFDEKLTQVEKGEATAMLETPEADSALTVISAPSLIDESLTSGFSGIQNLDEFVTIITSQFDDVSNVSIAAKSLSVSSNTVTNASFWNILFMGIIPVVCIIGGFIVWFSRRRA